MFSSLFSLSNSSTELEEDKSFKVDTNFDNILEEEEIALEKQQFDNHNQYYENCKELSAEFIAKNYLECKDSHLFLSDIWCDEHEIKLEDVEGLYIYDKTDYEDIYDFMIIDRKLAQNVLSNIKIKEPIKGVFIKPEYKWNFIISIYTKTHIYTARELRQCEYENVFTASPRF
jgi:hypothetical protein